MLYEVITTPEMVAAVSKLMRNQDLILVARKCRVVTRFRNTIGLPGHLAVRLQPGMVTSAKKAALFSQSGMGVGGSVITSYSIHYTKLYEAWFLLDS